MPLQSTLFKGDPKLEACLLHDSAHITEGAAGGHVAKVQSALQSLGTHRIDASELSTRRYGRSTAAAVLDYKTRRSIINHTYQTRPDAIVGKMTIAALDRELCAREKPGDNWRLCGCRELSNRFFYAASFTPIRPILAFGIDAPPAAGDDNEVVKLAVSFVPEALTWVGASIGALDRLIGSTLTRDQVVKTPEFRRVQTHFHIPETIDNSLLDKLLGWIVPGFESDPVQGFLKLIRFRFWDIRAGLSKASQIFRFHDNTGEGENAALFTPTTRDGFMYVTPYYRFVGPINRPKILIHETVHWLGQDFQEWAIRDRTRWPENLNPRAYLDLAPELAVKNADSYAYFALEAAKGIQRVVLQDE